MRVGWDMQAVTGPKPTGLGIAAGMLQRAVEEHAPQVEIVALRPNLRNRALKGVLDRVGWEQVRLPRCIRKEADGAGLDLFFSPALGVPLQCAVPKVAYVHDLIPLHYPQQFHGVAGWYWKELLPQTWRSCDALVVSNKVVADDLSRLIGYPRERIFIAPYPCNPEYAAIAAQMDAVEPVGRYFVSVGTLEPRKNIEQSIQALAILTARPQFADVKLVVIGMGTAHEARLRALAEQLGVGGKVEFLTDYVPTQEVVRRLRGAAALLSMSRYEGFGLPPLEAMSIGCPVIISNIPVHRAVYADRSRLPDGAGAAQFATLDAPDELAAAMQRCLTDPAWRADRVERALRYARTFTTEATARGLVGAFRAVCH